MIDLRGYNPHVGVRGYFQQFCSTAAFSDVQVYYLDLSKTWTSQLLDALLIFFLLSLARFCYLFSLYCRFSLLYSSFLLPLFSLTLPLTSLFYLLFVSLLCRSFLFTHLYSFSYLPLNSLTLLFNKTPLFRFYSLFTVLNHFLGAPELTICACTACGYFYAPT